MPRTTAMILAALAFTACSDSTGTTEQPPLLILGSDMGPRFQNFTISRGTTPVTDAVVTINGVTLPASTTGGYSYDTGTFLQPGETLVLRIVQGGETIEGRATIIGGTTMVAPVANQSITFGQPLSFAWTATTDPDFWRVGLTYSLAGAGNGIQDSVPRSARSRSLATATVPTTATQPIAYVFGYLRGTFTGRVDPASTMKVRSINLQAVLTKAQ